MTSYITNVCGRNPDGPVNLTLDCDGVLYLSTKPIFFQGPISAFQDLIVCLRNPIFINCRCIDFQHSALSTIPPFTVNVLDLLEDGSIGSNSYYNVPFALETVNSGSYQYKLTLRASVTNPEVLDLSGFEGCDIIVQFPNAVPLTQPIPCINTGGEGCVEFKGKFTIVETEAPTFILSLNKTETSTGPYLEGDTITFTLRATNNGNQPLTNVQLTDNNVSPPFSETIPTMAPGEVIVRNVSYTVTALDLQNGSYTNIFRGTSTESPPEQVENTTPLVNPAFSLFKSGLLLGAGDIGDSIDYTITFTNTGNVNLIDATVIDAKVGPVSPLSYALVTPGQSVVFNATYTVTQTDVDNGQVTNTANGSAFPENNPTQLVAESSNEVILPTPGVQSLSLVKSVQSFTGKGVGDTITYQFEVTNTGTVTLNNVTVTDPNLNPTPPNVVAGPIASLAPGASQILTAPYVITVADDTAGVINNTATATGTPANGQPDVNDTSDNSFSIRIVSTINILNDGRHWDDGDIQTTVDSFFDGNLDRAGGGLGQDQRLHQGSKFEIIFNQTYTAGEFLRLYWSNEEQNGIKGTSFPNDILGLTISLRRASDGAEIQTFQTGNDPTAGNTRDLPIGGETAPYKIIDIVALEAFNGFFIESFNDNRGQDPRLQEIQINGIPN